MAREDILVDSTYGELVTADNPAGRVIYDFVLLEEVAGMDNEHYAYGEISLAQEAERRYDEGSSVHVRIPYTAVYLPLRVRFHIATPGGGEPYRVNPANNTPWFDVQRTGGVVIRLSEYAEVNADSLFRLVRRGGTLELYSGTDTDVRIGAALRQNEVFLLKASPGSLYQHPTTGVGLIDFLHGNFETTGLAARLQREFENDRMIINNAYMDSETGELLLDVTEKE